MLQAQPLDIKEAMDIAVLIEEKLNRFQGGYSAKYSQKLIKAPTDSITTTARGSGFQKQQYNSSSIKVITEIQPDTGPSTSNRPTFKRLSAAERKQRREKGLCFNCDEKFFQGHVCKAKLFRLSADESEMIEVVETDEYYYEENETDNSGKVITEISCNALKGQVGANTIRLLDNTNRRSVFWLIQVPPTILFKLR